MIYDMFVFKTTVFDKQNLATLTGKYGEEGDKLLFKILNSGDFLAKASESDLAEKSSRKVTSQISEKGLRYDLTVPFARYVVQHQNDISFPFKRYQIQPVWRADRPQKGRYREFWQCDVDVIGSRSLLNDMEMIQVYDESFTALDLKVTIHLNSRKILQGFCESMGVSDQFSNITVTIDKLDKAGEEKVRVELGGLGLSSQQVDSVFEFLHLSGTNDEKLEDLTTLLDSSEVGISGIAEIKTVLNLLTQSGGATQQVVFNQGLARGLDYYTGCIFEVTSDELTFGSLGGGGRYDNLTEIFGLKDVSGVGISLGLDRIYDVMLELNKFPETVGEQTKILFINFDDDGQTKALEYLGRVRNRGIAAEIYPDQTKLQKQMKYANAKQIPYVGMIGSREIEEENITLKNMETGDQQTVSFNELLNKLEA